jgi:signal transduction histidine kinase
VNQQSVLIIADQPAFARDVVSHWQMERVVPAFTIMSSEFFSAPHPGQCDLAIVDGTTLPEARLNMVLQSLESRAGAIICVVSQQSRFHGLKTQYHRVLPLKQNEEWLGAIVVLGTEVLRRQEAAARLRRADQVVNAHQSQAALGRFMLETRHGFNNALTSVLGNAELLLLETASLSPEMREQVETIHSMALRLHEMMQRFSSLEAEMQFAEREARTDARPPLQAYASGS